MVMKRMKHFTIIALGAILLCLTSCVQLLGRKGKGGKMPVEDSTYIADKKAISDIYLDNIEYYRLYHIFEDKGAAFERKHYEKYPRAEEDPGYIYMPYSRRWDIDSRDYPSPIPTRQQVDVSVDTIHYDKTGTFFVAFVCIEKYFNKIAGFVNREHRFDARAVVGYRDTCENVIKIYPLSMFVEGNFESKESALRLLRYDHWYNVRGNSLCSSIYDERFKNNVDDPKFFENSMLFKKYDQDHYYFQMYMDGDKVKEYRYPYGN